MTQLIIDNNRFNGFRMSVLSHTLRDGYWGYAPAVILDPLYERFRATWNAYPVTNWVLEDIL